MTTTTTTTTTTTRGLFRLLLLLSVSTMTFAFISPTPYSRMASRLLATEPMEESASSGKLVKEQDTIQQLLAQLESFDASALTKNADSIVANSLSGEWGTRGEAYVAAQFALLLCVVLGGIPFVGDPLAAVVGPSLMVAGVGVIVLGVKDLGASLSPWVVPAQEHASLVQTGIYAQLRHPLYAGLLAASAGFSIVTDSASRLLLTAILWYVLDVKSDFEEGEMLKQFPDYVEYKDQVPGKFFPQALLDQLPWNNKE